MSDIEERNAARRDAEIARTAGRKPASEFTSKVVGVSFVPGYPDNLLDLAKADVNAAAVGERLIAILHRNPANEYDPNAIEVHVPALGDGGFIGHLTRPIVARMAPDMDAGAIWHAEVANVLIDPDHLDRPGIEIHCKRMEN